MKLKDLKTELAKHMYLEDTGVIDVSLASIIATRLNIGDPVWLLIIGESSGGKSQIIRPITMTDEKFIHAVDDITENTFLSGSLVENSFLKRVGSRGILSISDMTVLFSKSSEARGAVLSQLRMIYDGKMVKMTGKSDKPIVWEGKLGVLSGCTPSAYRFFEEYADMGERFIYYRMRKNDPFKATKRALSRKMSGKALDTQMSDVYETYIKDICVKYAESEIPDIPEDRVDELIHISTLCSSLRTPVHYNSYTQEIEELPTPEMPMRVTLQLKTVLQTLRVMRHNDTGSWDITDEMMKVIAWCAYSLASEKKRSILSVLNGSSAVSTGTIANTIGLSTAVVKSTLQSIAAVGIVERGGGDHTTLTWSISGEENKRIIGMVSDKIEGIEGTKEDF